MEKIDQYLIIIEVFQLLLFSVILFFELNSKNISRKILGILFFVLLLIYGNLGLFYLGYTKPAEKLFYLFSASILMVLPFFYLYIKSLTTENFIISKKMLKHFIPAIAVFLINTPLYAMLDPAQKAWFIEYGYIEFSDEMELRILTIISTGVSYVILLIQLIFYTYHIIKALKEHKRNIGQIFSNFKRKKLNWIRYIIFLFFIVFIFNNIFLQTEATNIINLRIIYNIAVIILTFFLGFAGMRQIDIYAGIDLLTTYNDNTLGKRKNAIKQDQGIQTANEKYGTSGLSETEKRRIVVLLNQHIANDKLFLNPDLKIADVSKAISVTQKNISFAINESLNTNFYHFVNRFRIEESKTILSEDTNNHFSIEGIAQKSGFNSRSSFYTAFKKYAGKTPGEYRMHHRKN